MGKTIAEKIIARVAGKSEVNPGDIVWIKPDLTGAYNTRSPSSGIEAPAPDVEALVGVAKLKNPEKIVMVLDHYHPAREPLEAERHIAVRKWCEKYGVRLYEGVGISHQAVIELGLVRPGMFYAHHDTEATVGGGIGVLVVGALPLLEIYVTGETWLKVPVTLRFNITGKLPAGVMSRDVMHMIISNLEPDEAVYKVMEFGGPTVDEMNIDRRLTMCSMANHAGAKSGIVNPDRKSIDFVKAITKEPFEAVCSDPDAAYEKTYGFDISNLEPYVAAPPNVFNCKPLREVEGTPIDQGYIGSCGGGRLDDLRAAAAILKGRHISPRVRLFIVPNTPYIMRAADEEGLLQTFIGAGAFISSPTCSFCYGESGAMAPGEKAITTGTLNIPGRMGSEESEIYLANAFSIAASAIEGKITDPRKYL